MSKSIGQIFGKANYATREDYLRCIEDYLRRNNINVAGQSHSSELIQSMFNGTNYSPYGLTLQTEPLTAQGTQYAQITNPNIATDADTMPPVDYSLYGDGFSREFIDQMVGDKEFQKILNEYIIPNEGGYNNDPVDAGGETNLGIAQSAHPNEDIINMTRERANAIYYRDYYNWNGLNKLPYPIRGFVVDYGLPTNPQYALQTVHNVLGIPKNATVIGPTTLKSFEHYTEADYNDFLEKYREEMKKHYNDIVQKNPQKKKFLKGWTIEPTALILVNSLLKREAEFYQPL
ncbi:MAG: hypothetical protein IJ770_05315 [Alphaproteobacteria bacterium]|nr:hypothetical protein [Alphaproteobacteria bacterium]